MRRELGGLGAERALEVPVRAGVEGHPRSLALDDQAGGDALDPPGRASRRRPGDGSRPTSRSRTSRSRTRRPVWASTSFMSSSRGFPIASSMALRVISWNTIRLTGTDGSQHLEDVPRDRLTLAVLVGGEIDLARVLERRLQLLDDVLLLVGDDPDRLEVVVDVDREAAHVGSVTPFGHLLRAARQVADVAVARLHRVLAATEEAFDGARLRRRFDDHERFRHDALSTSICRWIRSVRSALHWSKRVRSVLPRLVRPRRIRPDRPGPTATQGAATEGPRCQDEAPEPLWGRRLTCRA